MYYREQNDGKVKTMNLRFSSKMRGTIIRRTEEQQKMREEERIVRQHERDIADNKTIEYQVKEVQVVKVDLPRGIHTTTCLNCKLPATKIVFTQMMIKKCCVWPWRTEFVVNVWMKTNKKDKKPLSYRRSALHLERP